MRDIVGFAAALITLIVMKLLGQFVLRFEIPEFLIGWVSYMAFAGARGFYEDERKKL